ncbi:general transcription factor II-I repeat domain-containing protein 2-like [Halictus rubicundus]|uniref:general transcription factor II-I repeat domain-containing protein 2-like n=1 Tax=Halictus rubicundus TaxID=77578 RepID=UPI004035E13E
MAKRKFGRENRMFQKSWETDFFFVDCGGQPQCLICKKKVAGMKKCNVSRHYNTCHSDIYNTCSLECRVQIVRNLKQLCDIDDTEVTAPDTIQQQSVAASYAVALEIARAKKSFSDGELIKRCAIEMAKAFGNKTAVESFKTVSLSRHTISRRVSEINGHLENKLKILLDECRYFSLYLNENTDRMDVSQLSIFVRMISDDFSIHKELLALVPLHSTTKGEDIFNDVYQQVEKYGGFSKCSAIVMNGTKTLVGQETEFRELLIQHGINCPTFYCTIHQEELCGKVLILSSTMKIVTRILNLIRGGNRALLHKKLKPFLQDVNATPVNAWLNAADTLKRFFNSRDNIAEFLRSEVQENVTDIQDKFKNIEFLSELAFLTDITNHLNNLNSNLQKHKTISDLVGCVKQFQNHLQLFIDELEANQLHNFPSCEEISRQYSTVNFSEFQTSLLEIQEYFQNRFSDFDLLKNDLEIFNNPKECVIKNQEIAYRLELCDLQTDPFLLSRNEYGLEFFKLLSKEKYPKLADFSLKLCSMFGSTYKNESSFSIMKHVKPKYRSSLTDESLCSLLRIATSTIPVDTASLTTEMSRPQFSH